MGQSACYTGVSSYVFDSIDARQVMQKQHRVSAFNLPPGTGNADLLDFVAAVAQAGGVDHMQRHAFDLYGLGHHIARGARHWRHDGQLGACQRIEQRAFSGVRLPGNHHLDAFAQQRTLARLLEQAGQHLLQIR